MNAVRWCQNRGVDEIDVLVRNVTYDQFVRRGQAPTIAEVAAALSLKALDIAASWRRLHDAHALVLHSATGDLLMLNPFSMAPTAYRVQAGERWWYANCAWDAFGVCAALGVDGRIETWCPDCAGRLVVRVASQRPDDITLLFHCLVSAAHWWDDIVFT